MALHDLAIVTLNGRRVYLAGGRVMAVLALCALMWFSLAHDRAQARHQLASITAESYRAQYDSAVAKLRNEAKQSDMYLFFVSSILAVFVVLYELAALGFGWILAYVAEHPRLGAGPRRE